MDAFGQVLERLENLNSKIDGIATDVAVIKAKDYDERVKDVERRVSSHGERLAKSEVRSGYISAFVGSAIAGLISLFFSGQQQ